jgi:hypothetical protein
LLRGQIFGIVPFDQSLDIPSFTLQKFKDTSMGDVCGFNCHLVLASNQNPSFHTKSTFEKGDFVGFWISMDWDNEI